MNKVIDKMEINNDMFHLGMHNRIETKLSGINVITKWSGGSRNVTPCTSKRDFIHTISKVAVASALYSASVQERATTFCFLVRQLIGLLPIKII